MEVIGMGLMGITLGVQSYWDIRYKQIPILVTGLLGAVGIVLSVLRERPLTDILMALTPGLVCLLIGKITEEAIGYGDGFLLCAMGAIVSREMLFAVGLMAVIFAGLYGMVMLVWGRKKASDRFPFVPFLLLGFLFVVLFKGVAGL